jgi:hypothetical protein
VTLLRTLQHHVYFIFTSLISFFFVRSFFSFVIILSSFCLYYSNIRIQNSQVIPVPLFIPLDGKHDRDYVARVEPSAHGGKKMAEFFLNIIDNNQNDDDDDGIMQYQSYQAPIPSPSAAFISGRH